MRRNGQRLRRWGVPTAYLLLAALVVAGCGGGKKYPTATVQGKISVDGQSVNAGKIVFTPLGSEQGQAASGSIANGAYVAKEVPRGKVLVKFDCRRETGEKVIDAAGVALPQFSDPIPARYSAGLELEITGDMQHDFVLKSTED